MSWAEVKKINSDLSTPLNELIKTGVNDDISVPLNKAVGEAFYNGERVTKETDYILGDISTPNNLDFRQKPAVSVNGLIIVLFYSSSKTSCYVWNGVGWIKANDCPIVCDSPSLFFNVNNNIYATNTSKQISKLNIDTLTWSTAVSISGTGSPREYQIPAFVIGTDVYFLAGTNFSVLHTSNDNYEIVDLASPPISFANYGGGVIDNEIHAIGGTSDAANGYKSHYKYNPSTQTWTQLNNCIGMVGWPTSFVLNNELHLVGSWTGDYQNCELKWVKEDDSWEVVNEGKAHNLRDLISVIYNNMPVIIGSKSGEELILHTRHDNENWRTAKCVTNEVVRYKIAGEDIIF